MPYIPPSETEPRGRLVGSFDGDEIPRRQQATIVGFGKRMISRPTKAEHAFLVNIANRIHRRTGVRYIRQRSFFIAKGFSFIADFYFPKFKLAVEIDGSSHRQRQEYDAWRDRLLNENEGVRVVRFTNAQVLNRSERTFHETVTALLTQKRSTRSCWNRLRRYLGHMSLVPVPLKR